MNEVTERIVYQESAQAIAQQLQKLEALRGRSGTLLAASSLVAAFLGGRALQGATVVSGTGWAAIGCFIAVLVSAVVLLMPWPWRWTFSHNAHALMDQLLDREPPASEAEVYRHLAYYNQVHWRSNAEKLAVMFGVLLLGLLALVAETTLWLVVVAK